MGERRGESGEGKDEGRADEGKDVRQSREDRLKMRGEMRRA